MEKVKIKPFIKWVGGKRKLAELLIKNMPAEYNDYYEPFVGGGALFFKVAPKRAFLSDVNRDLITTYRVVRDQVDSLICALEVLKEGHNKDYYKKIKEMHALNDPILIAARFIYLNKTCFSGFHKTDREGRFNVGMGDYKNPAILEEDTLRSCSDILRNKVSTRFAATEYSKIKPKERDFVYIDPPYDGSKIRYYKDDFNTKSQEELADFCKALHSKGVFFMQSNADTENIRNLYKDFNIIEVMNNRSTPGTRGAVKELLIRNYVNELSEETSGDARYKRLYYLGSPSMREEHKTVDIISRAHGTFIKPGAVEYASFNEYSMCEGL